MADVLTRAQRAHNMSRIRSKDTKPEMILRQALHAKGLRYRTHLRGVPGTPDLAFTKAKIAIFVNGCFWHTHDCRWGAVRPATNSEFWAAKRQATVDRDTKKRVELETMGWRVLTVWECELKDPTVVVDRVFHFVRDPL
jgi:DNA mismatch endonuclease (patch repair protein)